MEARSGSDGNTGVWRVEAAFPRLAPLGFHEPPRRLLPPAEHRGHLRTTNPIASTCSTIRLWHRRTQGSGSRKDMPFRRATEASAATMAKPAGMQGASGSVPDASVRRRRRGIPKSLKNLMDPQGVSQKPRRLVTGRVEACTSGGRLCKDSLQRRRRGSASYRRTCVS